MVIKGSQVKKGDKKTEEFGIKFIYYLYIALCKLILNIIILILHTMANTKINCIKVSQTGKGESHWELQLLHNQDRRLNKFLTQRGTDPWIHRKILTLSKRKLNKENIIPISSHPIEVYLVALIKDNLEFLIKNSTTQNF